jgi:hypothetical protein
MKKIEDYTYTELNEMFSDLIGKHEGDTEFFSKESAKKFANDELISGDYLCVQNAFDDLAAQIKGLKDVFSWSAGVSANNWDVGLMHLNAHELMDETLRDGMIKAECIRRGVDVNVGKEYQRIVKGTECCYI